MDDKKHGNIEKTLKEKFFKFETIIDRNELRRLEKAAKEKDKKHLEEWAKQLEGQIRGTYDKAFDKALGIAIDNFVVALAYTLHFNEDTKFGRKRLPPFLEDLFVTVDLFLTGEYNVEDYKKELEKCGIFLDEE